MIRSYRNSGSQPGGGNWRDALETIKAGNEELRRYGGMMTEYERSAITRDLKARSEAIFPAVAGAVIAEFRGAIAGYQKSMEAIDRARTAEINRFDSAKFNTELQTIQSRVKLAYEQDVNPMRGADTPASQRLAAIYAEAVQSGDLTRQRAAVEVFKALPLPPGDEQERIAINDLAKNAEATEPKLRDTPELAQARQARTAALDALGAKQQQLVEVSQQLGAGDPRDPFAGSAFAQAYKLVEWPRNLEDNDGGPKGEIVIHKETDPEVTGVLWK